MVAVFRVQVRIPERPSWNMEVSVHSQEIPSIKYPGCGNGVLDCCPSARRYMSSETAFSLGEVVQAGYDA